MRSRKALLNSAASLFLEFVTVICGFIVPRLIIGTYGSEVNALTSSITQFLSYIALVEAGVGGVIRAALYKPLAEKDNAAMSGIIRSTEIFFRRIAFIFVGYMAVLAAVFPVLVNKNFGWAFTASLVIIIGLSTFAQYYFGMTYTVLVQSDQRRYITSFLQIATIILNAVMVVVFIKLGASIHILKLGTSLIYVLRPLALNIYVRRKYNIDKKAEPDNEAVAQRWDGLGHHIAYFVNLNTDVVILTVFSKISSSLALAEVSVYTVYYSVVNGIMKVAASLSAGVEAALGDMIAKKEYENLNKKFNLYEFVSFNLVTVLFTCAGLLIVPFMKVYMHGVTDANYIRPLFGYILVLANAMYSIRIPYHSVVYAAGHYRQTRNGAFAEAGINVAVSAVLVYFYGIVGVAIGTLVAMTFRTVQYVFYLSKNILNRSVKFFFKRMAASILTVAASVLAVHFVPSFGIKGYLGWVLYACVVGIIVLAMTCAVDLIFCRKDFIGAFSIVKNAVFIRLKKKK